MWNRRAKKVSFWSKITAAKKVFYGFFVICSLRLNVFLESMDKSNGIKIVFGYLNSWLNFITKCLVQDKYIWFIYIFKWFHTILFSIQYSNSCTEHWYLYFALKSSQSQIVFSNQYLVISETKYYSIKCASNTLKTYELQASNIGCAGWR